MSVAVHESGCGPGSADKGMGRAGALCPVRQTSTCSAIARASSTSMPRYRTVLSILGPTDFQCAGRSGSLSCVSTSAFRTASIADLVDDDDEVLVGVERPALPDVHLLGDLAGA